MISISIDNAQMDGIVSFFQDDIRTRTKSGLFKVGKIIQENVKDSFDTGGERSGYWEPTPLFWLRQRKTWPHQHQKNQLTSAQINYLKKALPLVDTGKLASSFKSPSTKYSKAGITWELTSTTNYGWRHEFGVPGPNGPKKLHKRPHLFILYPSETQQIDSDFVKEFQA